VEAQMGKHAAIVVLPFARPRVALTLDLRCTYAAPTLHLR
jgi:hypothetical protein